MIDSHCHLADAKFQSDLPEVLSRAEQAGVEQFVTIADTIEEGEKCLELAEKYEQVFCTIGVHPHVAKTWSPESADRVREMAQSSSKVVAIGEIGLDYHYMNSPRDDQLRAFREQIGIAKELGLPIVVHNRESIADFKDVISDCKPEKMVLHCCTEQWEDVKDLVDRGYLLGFTGIATYPKSEAIRETIAQCPMTQMMVETDAPYLAPEGLRGKRCEPAYVMDVARLIATIKGVDLSEVDTVTTKNAEEFYGL